MRQFLNKPSETFGSHCVAAAARRCTWALAAPYGLGASAPVKPEAVSLLWALAPLPLLSWLICGPSAGEVFGPEPHQGPSQAMASCLCALTCCVALGSLTSLLLPGLWPLRTGTSCIPRAARRHSASAWGTTMSLGDVVREPLWACLVSPLLCEAPPAGKGWGPGCLLVGDAAAQSGSLAYSPASSPAPSEVLTREWELESTVSPCFVVIVIGSDVWSQTCICLFNCSYLLPWNFWFAFILQGSSRNIWSDIQRSWLTCLAPECDGTSYCIWKSITGKYLQIFLIS